jgi:hypothetical protein
MVAPPASSLPFAAQVRGMSMELPRGDVCFLPGVFFFPLEQIFAFPSSRVSDVKLLVRIEFCICTNGLHNFRPISVWLADLAIFYIFTGKAFGEP